MSSVILTWLISLTPSCSPHQCLFSLNWHETCYSVVLLTTIPIFLNKNTYMSIVIHFISSKTRQNYHHLLKSYSSTSWSIFFHQFQCLYLTAILRLIFWHWLHGPHKTLSFNANVFIVRGTHHIQPCPRKYDHFMAFMCHMSIFLTIAVQFHIIHPSVISKSTTWALGKSINVMLWCHYWHSGLQELLKGLLPSVVPFSLWCFNGFTSKCLCCPALSELTHPATLMVICPWGEVAFKCQHMMLQHRPSRNWRKDH